MGVLNRWAAGFAMLGMIFVSTVACDGEEGGPGRYSAHGVVEDVDLENGQVLIDHEDVEGLMPAMTMNFAVAKRSLLEKLAPGQVIDFKIHFTGRSYDVIDAVVVGEAGERDGWFRLRDGLVRTTPAPPFDLIDQAGRAVSLESLGDRVLIVDFIYTSCPGPCPVQTSNQVELQHRIPEMLRSEVQFISISLDPEVDRPEVLKRYAIARGADLSNWSFLTGPTDAVADVVRRWGVGAIRTEEGTIEHTLIRFLAHEGRVIERYWTSDDRDEALLADLTALAESRRSSRLAGQVSPEP